LTDLSQTIQHAMTYQQILEAAQYIQSRLSFKPRIGIILGTGLGALAEEVEVQVSIAYDAIPHFPVSTVESHTGRLLLGTLAGQPVVVMQGRFHYYEGYSMAQVTFPVRVMKVLGIETLILSNAAGGLHPDHELSDLMIIEDHINLQPENPLTGRNLDELGVRFPDMYEPYDQGMIRLGLEIARERNIRVHTGVYASVPGPNLETRAEYRYLRAIGADAVGMSTVPEVIVARQMHLPCFAVSVITDLCVPEKLKPVAIADVLTAAAKAEPELSLLTRELVKRLS
jgi:purine-nucleoside phosphorylase